MPRSCEPRRRVPISRPSYVLGISAYYHDSAAALVGGSNIIAAAQEERFTRLKGDQSFPRNAIDYCLSNLPVGSSVDAVAYYENPRLKMDRIVRNAARFAPRGSPAWLQTPQRLFELNYHLPQALRDLVDDPNRIFFCSHHRSHAASAFYPSPYQQAAVLVVDGVGEWSSTSIWHGSGRTLEPLKEIKFPNSLGLFYSAFTQYCGFKVNSGEYKLMGLAPFGRPVYRALILDKLIDVRADGSFSIDLTYFDFHVGQSTINPLFEQLLGEPMRQPETAISQHYMDVAASVQAVTSDIMQLLAAYALKITGMRNLCLAGGVALNCVANGHLVRTLPELDGLWIQPAAGDAGGSLGAALNQANVSGNSEKSILSCNLPKADSMEGAYLGPEFDHASISAALEGKNLTFTRFESDEEICRVMARALAKGKVIGHFDGRMEFGPRALGNRSILADPRAQKMMSHVNLKVKFREGWRPFAPVIMAEKAEQFFEQPTDSPYMLLVTHIRDEFRTGPDLQEARKAGNLTVIDIQNSVTSEFSAVTHVDYSSRLQTVAHQSGARIRRILEAFDRLTGCPMLLNTSFNVRGEPIVCSPEDAIACFMRTDLDLLVIGNYIVRKKLAKKRIKRMLKAFTPKSRTIASRSLFKPTSRSEPIDAE